MKFSSEHLARCLLFLALAQCSLVTAQLPSKTPSNDNKNTRRTEDAARLLLDQRIETLIVLAENAPPEVGSDVLLTLSSSNTITEKQKKIEMVDQAFRMAAKAREPVKRRSVGRMTDTRAGFKQSAFDLGLDKLSMESNAVVKMLPLDRHRARMMFAEISLPTLRPLTCDESLVYDLDPYYQAELAVFEQAFSEDERRAGTNIQFLLDGLEKAKSLAQVVAVAKIVLKATLSLTDRALVASSFANSLDRVSSDPRSFAFAMEREPFLSTVHSIILKMKNDGLPVKDLTNATYRFLTKNLSAEVCADADWVKAAAQPKVPAWLEEINSEFAAPITVDEMRPSALGSKADDVVFWTTPKAVVLLTKAKELRFGEGKTELSAAQRQTEDWRQMLHDFLDLLNDWDAGAERSEEDYFQQKCSMYRVLVDLCPEDAERDLVLRTYGTYLKDASSTYKGRIEWISPVKQYLRILRSKSDKLRQSSMDPWLSSTDSNLRIYGELAVLMQTKS